MYNLFVVPLKIFSCYLLHKTIWKRNFAPQSGGFQSGQMGQTVNLLLRLRRFESFTSHCFEDSSFSWVLFLCVWRNARSFKYVSFQHSLSLGRNRAHLFNAVILYGLLRVPASLSHSKANIVYNQVANFWKNGVTLWRIFLQIQLIQRWCRKQKKRGVRVSKTYGKT